MSGADANVFGLSDEREGRAELQAPSDNYLKRESLGEIVIPYAYPTDVRNLISALIKTKMRRYLVDIDGPWVYSAGISALIAVPIAIQWTHRVWSMVSAMQVLTLIFVASLMILLMLILPIYFLVAVTNLRLKYGKDWLRTIMGPTHLGLTTSGIKFYWKGKFFYNYPLLRVWSAVEKVDLILPTEENPDVVPAILIEFAARPFYKTSISLPLTGFSNKVSLLRFLALVNQWAPKTAFGPALEHDGERDFKASISAFESLNADHLLEDKG